MARRSDHKAFFTLPQGIGNGLKNMDKGSREHACDAKTPDLHRPLIHPTTSSLLASSLPSHPLSIYYYVQQWEGFHCFHPPLSLTLQHLAYLACLGHLALGTWNLGTLGRVGSFLFTSLDRYGPFLIQPSPEAPPPPPFGSCCFCLYEIYLTLLFSAVDCDSHLCPPGQVEAFPSPSPAPDPSVFSDLFCWLRLGSTLRRGKNPR